MASRVEFYRRKAAECEQRAAGATYPAAKRSFQQLQRQWLHMTRRAEREETMKEAAN